MGTDANQRAEWERLLLGHQMPIGEDLPGRIRELLLKLDQVIGELQGGGDAPAVAAEEGADHSSGSR